MITYDSTVFDSRIGHIQEAWQALQGKDTAFSDPDSKHLFLQPVISDYQVGARLDNTDGHWGFAQYDCVVNREVVRVSARN